MNETNKPTMEMLKEHLHKYKDAIVIAGNKFLTNSKILSNDNDIENMEQLYTRKSWIKTPVDFWDYFINNIYTIEYDNNHDIYTNTKKLIDKNLIKTTISFNNDSNCPFEYLLNGTSKILYCNKCKHTLNEEETNNKIIDFKTFKDKSTFKCPECGDKLRPRSLFYNETYNPEIVLNLNKLLFKEEEGKLPIPNTHTLILIGVDTEETYFNEIYDNFNLTKNNNPNETYYTVMLTDDVTDTYLLEPDFASYKDINEAYIKLIDIIL